MILNWKKYVSIAMTTMLLAGNMAFSVPLMNTYAEETSSSEKDSSEKDSSGKDSSGKDSSDSEKSDDHSSNSSSEQSDKKSDSDSGGESNSSDAEKTETDSSGDESSATVSDSSDSDQEDTQSDDKSDSSSESNDSQNSQTEGNDDDAENRSDSSTQTAEDKDSKDTSKKTEKKKKIVKDDSDGKDYQKSETVSSGNLTFTIVAVSRDSASIDKKLKELKKKKKELAADKKKVKAKLYKSQKEISDIEHIYDVIKQEKHGAESVDLHLMGCYKDSALGSKEDGIEGLDDLLSRLAKTYNNASLRQWTSHYSTELQPMTIQISQTHHEEVILSDAAPILKLMEEEAKKDAETFQTELDQLQAKSKDVKEHINALKKKKKENILELDSRLLEYKDVIPDQAVDFLNAVVSREGAPYVWGSDGPNSFDCSGLVSYGLRQCGAVSAGFRWTSIDFASQLQSVTFEEAKPGDLVWKPGHIAIYIDANTVFEAPYTGANVRFTSCDVTTRFKRVLRWWSEK